MDESSVHPFDKDHPAEHSVLAKADPNPEEPVRISIILPTNAYFMSGVRDFTMTIVRNMTGFSAKWAYRFQLIVDELTNNAIEFGSSKGSYVTISFLSLKGKSIEIFVEDTGSGPIKKTAADLNEIVHKRKLADPTQLMSLRGRGLAQIVANWTDLMEFKDNDKGGITVHVVKKLEAGEQVD